MTCLAVGCSSESTNPSGASGASGSSGGCAAPTGNYLTHFEKTNGNCGDVADIVASVSAVPPGCTGTITPSADHCILDLNLECQEPLGATAKQIGTIQWAADGLSGTGVVTRTVSGVGSCQSTYKVTVSKA